MKQLASYAMLLTLTLFTATASAQTSSKPKQFNNFPDVIACSEATLSNIFNTAAGQNINLNFSDNFSFQGSVTSNVVKYSNLQTAVIRSPYFNNTIFSVSKIINKDNTVSYLGRMINKQFFDGYELKKNASGDYQLVKMETDRVIQDCRHQ